MPDAIRISDQDLKTQAVDDYVAMQQYLRRDVGPIGAQPWLIRVIYANWFYLAICSMIGGLAAWALMEPWYEDHVEEFQFGDILYFPAVTAGIGLFLGAAEGAICRNFGRAMRCGIVGLGIGFVGGLVAWYPTDLLYGAMTLIGFHIAGDNRNEDGMPLGLGLLVLMMGRAAAWSISSIPAGMGQGIALRERKVILNGVIGGVLGGLVGGLLFDPIAMFFSRDDGNAALSRAVGFACIGLFVGLFVGLVEGWTKTAWLRMVKGPLAGKQFILFKDTTTLGSSPKADIYLFKDDAIEPRHAVITNRGGRFEIEDCGTPDGTYINGIPIKQAILKDGDQIVLGKTVLDFAVTESDTR